MATSVVTSLPMWLAGCTYDSNAGNDLRNSGVSAFFYDEGIVSGTAVGVLGGVIGGAGLNVGVSSGMNITVQPGSFVAPNSGTPTAGAYVSTLSSQATLTVATSDPVNPRIDIVTATIVDNGDDTSFGEVQIITGTAAPSPTAPSLPANSILLAQIAVGAAVTSIVSGNISDQRPFTTATGGVLVAVKGDVTGYTGQLAFDKASGSFYHNNNVGGGPAQAHLLPFAPIHLINTASRTLGSTIGTLLSTNVTTDGMTDLKISWRIAQISATALATVNFHVVLDSADLESSVQTMQNPSFNTASGIVYTSSAAGTTPSAGTHSVLLRASGAGAEINSLASATQGMYLRIEPVGL